MRKSVVTRKADIRIAKRKKQPTPPMHRWESVNGFLKHPKTGVLYQYTMDRKQRKKH